MLHGNRSKMKAEKIFFEINKLLSDAILTLDGEERFRALGCITGLREKAKDCVPALIKSLNLPGHIDHKCHALGMIGRDAISAEDALINLLEHSNEDGVDKEYVLQALGRIGSVKAAPHYLEAVNSATKSSSYGLEFIVSGIFSKLRDRIGFLEPKIIAMYRNPRLKNKAPIVHVLLAMHSGFGVRAFEKLYLKAKKKEKKDLLSQFDSIASASASGDFRRALEQLERKTRSRSLKIEIKRMLGPIMLA